VARTQQERREGTVANLLDASIAAIVDVGYARASAAEITKRAGVSVGALFRHFETMGDFMAATAYEVLRRQLDEFSKRVAQIPADKPALEPVLTILRDITRNPTNTVMYELMIAARTDEKLRGTLQDVLTEYATKIYDVARAVPGAEGVPDEIVALMTVTMTNVFDGAAILRAIVPDPAMEARQISLLAELLTEAYGPAD
jgi:AcrR family transcriptional regulator